MTYSSFVSPDPSAETLTRVQRADGCGHRFDSRFAAVRLGDAAEAVVSLRPPGAPGALLTWWSRSTAGEAPLTRTVFPSAPCVCAGASGAAAAAQEGRARGTGHLLPPSLQGERASLSYPPPPCFLPRFCSSPPLLPTLAPRTEPLSPPPLPTPSSISPLLRPQRIQAHYQESDAGAADQGKRTLSSRAYAIRADSAGPASVSASASARASVAMTKMEVVESVPRFTTWVSALDNSHMQVRSRLAPRGAADWRTRGLEERRRRAKGPFPGAQGRELAIFCGFAPRWMYRFFISFWSGLKAFSCSYHHPSDQLPTPPTQCHPPLPASGRGQAPALLPRSRG